MKSAALLLLLVVGLAAAGCGSGGKSPSVASLGGDATTTSQTAAPPVGGLSSGGRGGSGSGFAMKISGGGLKYSKCMRAHGVHNFPDPNASGTLTFGSSSGIDPNSPTFRSAQAACAKNLPNGGNPSPQQLAKFKKAALAFSACMRAHGVKDFPDPDFTAGGIHIQMKGGPGSDLNPNNPSFQRARAACQNFLPQGKGKP